MDEKRHLMSIKDYVRDSKSKNELLEFLRWREVEHLDLIEDRELELILNTLGTAETMMSAMDSEKARIYYLKNLLKVIMASGILQAKALFMEKL